MKGVIKIMKKEIILKVVVDGEHIATAMQKNGFDSSLNSSFEIIGILQKILDDEKIKLEQKLRTTKDITVKEPLAEEDDRVYFTPA